MTIRLIFMNLRVIDVFFLLYQQIEFHRCYTAVMIKEIPIKTIFVENLFIAVRHHLALIR